MQEHFHPDPLGWVQISHVLESLSILHCAVLSRNKVHPLRICQLAGTVVGVFNGIDDSFIPPFFLSFSS